MKGDYIEITVAVGGQTHTARITATKAGRNVTRKNRGEWIDIREVRRTGTETGNMVSARRDAVVLLSEVRGDEDPAP